MLGRPPKLDVGQAHKRGPPEIANHSCERYAELGLNRPIEFEHLSKPYTAAHFASALEKAYSSGAK